MDHALDQEFWAVNDSTGPTALATLRAHYLDQRPGTAMQKDSNPRPSGP
jgi:hypothetical protein